MKTIKLTTIELEKIQELLKERVQITLKSHEDIIAHSEYYGSIEQKIDEYLKSIKL